MPTKRPGRVRPVGPDLRVRLRTLVLWRWLAVVGQAATLFAVDYVLGYEFPVMPAIICVLCSAWLNIVVSLRFSLARLLRDTEATAYLVYDLVQLSVLLYLTGGLVNPFSILFMVPVTIAATSLSLRATLIMGGLTIIAVTILTFHSLPLPWMPGEVLAKPGIYLAGTWLALIIGLMFLAGYAWRLAEEARRMTAALAAAQRALESEQRLSAVGTLAAAAAHELGTPLATIVLVAKELARDLDPEGPHGEDLKLLISQSMRCRDILAQLSQAPDRATGGAIVEESALPLLVQEAAKPHEGFDISIEVELSPTDKTPPPVFRRSPELMHGLGNFIENAVDFARKAVRVEIRWSDKDLWVRIFDDGPGFSPAVLDRLGEPYLTTRAKEKRRPAEPPLGGLHDLHDRDIGMGLGVFIAKTLLERTGATITFANGANGGAIVAMHWLRPARLEPSAGQAYVVADK
jgi:two-component system sensor histidine kinase RegB